MIHKNVSFGVSIQNVIFATACALAIGQVNADERVMPTVKPKHSEIQLKTAIKECKEFGASMWQSNAKQPISLEFPVAELAPESDTASRLSVRIRMVAHFAEAKEQTIRMTCGFALQGSKSVEFTGAASGGVDTY